MIVLRNVATQTVSLSAFFDLEALYSDRGKPFNPSIDDLELFLLERYNIIRSHKHLYDEARRLIFSQKSEGSFTGHGTSNAGPHHPLSVGSFYLSSEIKLVHDYQQLVRFFTVDLSNTNSLYISSTCTFFMLAQIYLLSNDKIQLTDGFAKVLVSFLSVIADIRQINGGDIR